MKHRRTWAALVAVLVLAGLAVGFVLWRDAARERAAVTALLTAVDAELGAGEPDRSEAGRLLREVREIRARSSDPALARAEARLLLGVGRVDDAWRLLAPRADSPLADVEDLALGARLVARLHAATGEEARAGAALRLAGRWHGAVPAVEPAFLAWQVAYRSGGVAEWWHWREVLLTAHAGTPEAELARLSCYEFAQLLARRHGVSGPVDEFERVARELADSEAGLAAQRTLECREEGESLRVEQLEQLAERFTGAPPPELRLLLAMAAIATSEAEAVRRGADVVREIIREVPSWIEPRHVAVVAAFGLTQGGELDPAEREVALGHLKWLLQNSAGDARQRQWQQLQARL